MKSLWLSSLLIFFLSCVITSKLSKRKETSDTTTIQNYFSNKGNTFQYKTDVTIYGKFFSGILFIKFTNDTTCRVAFTTPPGAKLFEMQLTPKTSTTFEVIKQMDRAIVIKAIQKNIRMFVMLDNFIGETKKRIGAKIELIENQPPFERLLTLLSILSEMEEATEFKVLNAEGFTMEMQMQDNDKINTIFNYVKDNFQQPITLDEVAALVSMTVPSFCRYFKKITQKTFTKFVNEYRLVHASKLLAEKPISITEVCFECGFNNFSYFNKSFQEFTGKSASQYRKELRSVLE